MSAERVNLEHARSRVEVVEYREEWPRLFQLEREVLADALGEAACEIHHIGSTSVPGLASKPTLDILVVTTSIELILQRQAALDAAGYDAKGPTLGLAHHYFFRRIEDGRRKVHLHVIERGHPEIDAHLLFRHWLRENGDARSEYSDYKRRLAHSSRDREDYVTTKERYVDGLLDRAREWRAEMRG